jgi:hypothetical protein
VPKRHRQGLSVFGTVAWGLVGISLLGAIGVVLRRRHIAPSRPDPDPQNPPIGPEIDADNRDVAAHRLGASATPVAGDEAGTISGDEALRATLAEIASRLD